MAFGQPPGEAKAAEEAQRRAIEIAENRKMSPFERKLIGVLEDIRDNIAKCAPEWLEPAVVELSTGRHVDADEAARSTD